MAPLPSETRGRILWIDDGVAPNDGACLLLKTEGFDLDCVDTGRRGLVLASHHPFDVILLDLRLPDLSGLAVLESLKAAQVPTPVAILTGFPDVESAVAAMKVNDYGTQLVNLNCIDQVDPPSASSDCSCEPLPD